MARGDNAKGLVAFKEYIGTHYLIGFTLQDLGLYTLCRVQLDYLTGFVTNKNQVCIYLCGVQNGAITWQINVCSIGSQDGVS